MNTGIFNILALNKTGKATFPPLLKIISGNILKTIKRDLTFFGLFKTAWGLVKSLFLNLKIQQL
ncbi:hypothetical protein KJ603_01660, partial [Patescibacteria group bacterium]|nr:hypothetical protein [Patescibacteria group bacterium]